MKLISAHIMHQKNNFAVQALNTRREQNNLLLQSSGKTQQTWRNLIFSIGSPDVKHCVVFWVYSWIITSVHRYTGNVNYCAPSFLHVFTLLSVSPGCQLAVVPSSASSPTAASTTHLPLICLIVTTNLCHYINLGLHVQRLAWLSHGTLTWVRVEGSKLCERSHSSMFPLSMSVFVELIPCERFLIVSVEFY